MTTKIGQAQAAAAPQSILQTAKSAALHCVDKAQAAAKTVFGAATHPGTVYLVASSAIVSLGTGTSFGRSFLANSAGIACGLMAMVGRVLVQEKLSPKAPVVEVEAPPARFPVLSVTKENFKKEVLSSQGPVVLNAHANSFPSSKWIAASFASLSEDLAGKIKFVQLDIEAQKGLKEELKIDTVPTFVFFKSGKEIGRHTNSYSQANLLAKCVAQFY